MALIANNRFPCARKWHFEGRHFRLLPLPSILFLRSVSLSCVCLISERVPLASYKGASAHRADSFYAPTQALFGFRVVGSGRDLGCFRFDFVVA